MPKEPEPLIITAPSSGIASSPHTGFGDVRNLDLFELPGIVKLNNILAPVGTSITDTIKWIVRDPVTNGGANFYAVDGSGDVYVSTDTGASFAALGTQPTAGGEGQGLAIWKDHLFCARETALDVYGPLSSSPNWNSGFKTDLTSDLEWHPMLPSKLDDKLYIGSGRYMATLAEVAGETFLDDDTDTYAWSGGDSSNNALDLPQNYRIKCLAELGNNIMMGTWVANTTVGKNIKDNKIADIFTWDGQDTDYGNPIQMTENGVNAMINIGGNLYILAGIDGNIYKSNGVQAWKIGEIPISVADTSGGKYLVPYPGAIINFKGKLFFGMSATEEDDFEMRDGVGIYSLTETSNGNILNLEHVISDEVYGSANPTIIGALLGVGRDQLIAGWRNNTSYDIDLTTTTSFAYTTAYSGYFESRLRDVGTTLNRRKYNAMEFVLAKELTDTEGIRVKFRINLTDSFTTIGTYLGTDIGSGNTSFRTEEINIPECEQIQVRVELLGTSTTTPEFKSLTLI